MTSNYHTETIAAIRETIYQLSTIQEQLNDRWHEVKENPFDLNNLLQLIAKTTMAVNYIIDQRIDELDKSVEVLERIDNMGEPTSETADE